MTAPDPDLIVDDGGTLYLTAAERLARTQPRHWAAHGDCVGADPDMWFPGRGEDVNTAKSICATCPVRQPCRDYGMSEKYGIWGGVSYRERRRIIRRRHLAVIAAAPDEAA